MRRSLLGILVLAVFVAGCGSSSTPGAPANPLASELSYFPVQSPVVITFQTGPNSEIGSAIKTLQNRFPVLGLAKAAALQKLQQQGINYASDIKPLLGNPIAFGTNAMTASTFAQHFLVVWVTHDAGKVGVLLHKLHGLRSDGTHGAAKLYAMGSGGELAVDGATLVLSRVRDDVIAGLDRHAHGQGLTAAQHSADVQGLDGNAAMQVFGDLQSTLAGASAAKARRDPWVAALRSYGVSLSTTGSGLTFGFRLNTDASALTAAQIPIASGATSPALVSGLPIQVGIRNPAQIVNFVLSAVQSTSAHGYASFLRQEASVRRRTGVDLKQFLGELSGDMVIDSDTHTTLIRAGVTSPTSVAGTLSKLASAPGGVGGGKSLKRVAPDAYAYVAGHRRALIGVVGSDLVIAVPPKGGTVQPSVLHSFAAAAAAAAPAASGSVAFRVSLSQVLALAAKKATQSATARQFLSLLGDLTGSMSATPAALSGSATLAFK